MVRNRVLDSESAREFYFGRVLMIDSAGGSHGSLWVWKLSVSIYRPRCQLP